jgi:hypothetical protein
MKRSIKKDQQKPRHTFVDEISKMMHENADFFECKAGETFAEVVGLVNDAIDLMGFFVESKEMKECYVKFAVAHYIHHVLCPLSYAMVIDLLTTNLVACFMELRLIVESLVKCYCADLKYPNQTFFQEKIRLLKEEMREQRISTSKLIKKCRKDAIGLWGRLSEGWLHTKGIIDRIVEEISHKSELPAWPLVMPITYTDTELDVLEELRRNVLEFRGLLNAVMEDWKKRFY